MKEPLLAQLTEAQRQTLHGGLKSIVHYRKSGLSLNHIIGCPLDCAYCIRHQNNNFDMKQPYQLASDEEAVATLVGHRFFIPHRTPLQLFNKATDPFLGAVCPHTHRTLALLDGAGLRNHILVITRYIVTEEDMRTLNQLQHVRITLLITLNGLKDKNIEPLSKNITCQSIKVACRHKGRTKVVLYWRPIVPGWNDDEDTMRCVLESARSCDAVAFMGLFHRKEQHEFFASAGITSPYPEVHRRKILPQGLEDRIIAAYKKSGLTVPLFRKTSCAVAFAHNEADYNGHYGVPDICDICPPAQAARCAASHRKPSEEEFAALLCRYGYDTAFEMDDGHVTVVGLSDEERYHLQHTLGFQIWDRQYPHLRRQHGRAPVGYERGVGNVSHSVT
jgi:DNA repair photolyase